MYYAKSSSVVCVFFTLVSLLTSWQVGVNCEQINSNELGTVNSGSNAIKQQQPSSFVSSAPLPTQASPVAGNDEYRATYFYPVPHHQNWNRDTYADAASDFGYQPQQHGTGPVPGAVYAPAYATGDIDGYDDSGFGGIGGGLGGLGGIAGILGLKGLKGLGILGLAKAAVPLLAILLPALLLLPLLFLFFPVPVITVPATQRSLMSGLNIGDFSGKMSHLARSVIESDKCVERISCEIGRVSRGSFIERTLKRVIPRFETHMPQTLRRMARVYMEGYQGGNGSCSKKYTCYLIDDGGLGLTAAKKPTITS